MYQRLLTSLQRATLKLDVAINRVYPTDLNPLYYTGGLTNLFLFLLVVTGIFIFSTTCRASRVPTLRSHT